MRTIRLLATSLLVALGMGVSSCGDDVTNEFIQQEPDNTLELLLGTWQGTGEAEGETLTFNKDNTYTEQDESYTQSGTFEYFQTDICLLLTIQLIGERRTPFTQ